MMALILTGRLKAMKLNNPEAGKPAQSTAQRQAAYRARKAKEGLVEVRGIFASAQDAERIKRFAAGL